MDVQEFNPTEDYDDEEQHSEEEEYEEGDEGDEGYEGDEGDEGDSDDEEKEGQEDEEHEEQDEGSPDTVFIGNMSFETTYEELEKFMKDLNLNPVETRVMEGNGKSRGCALVKFDSEESASAAIKALDNQVLGERPLFAREDRGPRPPRRRRRRDDQNKEKEPAPPNFVYVGNIVRTVTVDELKELFGRHGSVVKANIIKRSRNRKRSLNWGWVEFSSNDEATRALELHNTEFHQRPLRVEALEQAPQKRVRKKNNRRDNRFGNEQVDDEDEEQQPVRSRRRRGRGERRDEEAQQAEEELNPAHLYVGNLSWDVEEADLRTLFEKFGEIVSCEVARSGRNRSRGWGAVEFNSKEEADEATKELNETTFKDRPLDIQVRRNTKRKRRRNRNGQGQGRNRETDSDHHQPRNQQRQRQPRSGGDRGGGDRRGDRGGGGGQQQQSRRRERRQQRGGDRGEDNRGQQQQQQQQGEQGGGGRRRWRQRGGRGDQNDRQDSRDNKAAVDRVKVVTDPEAHLFVGNLSWSVSDEQLEELFTKYGPVRTAVVTKDRQNRSRGWGTVQMQHDQDSKDAIEGLNDSEHCGRKLIVRHDNFVKGRD